MLPSVQLNGQPVAPRLGHLGAAVARSAVSSLAATLISAALDRVRPVASAEQVETMEANLTRQAAESDVDVLRAVIRRWEDTLDPDGQEPSEEALRARQGVFLRGKRHGLRFIEILATDEQFEDLVTVMYSATNPRARAGLSASEAENLGDAHQPAVVTAQNTSTTQTTSTTPVTSTAWGASPGQANSVIEVPVADSGGDFDRSTWAQQLLDGLVGACRIALSTNELPAAGGLRPQVLVTIDYKELVADVGRAG
ncbi:DUF222 domain-containing protein, partial [Arthrobacter sp. HLT1-21]